MKINIRLFASAADAVGQKSMEWELNEGSTVRNLIDELVATYPKLGVLRSSLLVSVNQEYAQQDQLLAAGDEVGFIPPVSGGASTSAEPCRLTDGTIDPQQVLSQVSDDNSGAALLFLGTVREMTGEKQTLHLDYDAYPEMALAMMNKIVEKVKTRWPKAKVAITHRTGHLKIGDISVAIAVSCPHRAQAYEASRFAIDELKTIVPIWKKETWADGSSEWVGHS